MWKLIWEILCGALIIILLAVGIPIFILLVFVDMILGLFGVEFKDANGNVIKSWTQDKAKLGMAFLFLPPAILALCIAFGYFGYYFFLAREFLRNGHPILVILGVIVPIVGSCLFAYGMFSKNK